MTVLELQVLGLSDASNLKEWKREGVLQSTDVASACSWGMIGLQNIGATCYFNSVIQCLAHSQRFLDYFLANCPSEINFRLGKKGRIALTLGDLILKMRTHRVTSIGRNILEPKLQRIAPGFPINKHHDSGEYLDSLLEMLAEDLNRVKYKHNIPGQSGEDQLDEEAADRYWKGHLACDDSIIVDLFEGQYESTLLCPDCGVVSSRFTSFKQLQLPLASAKVRTMKITIMDSDGTSNPSSVTITLPKCEILSSRALSAACCLAVDEKVIVAQIREHRIICFLEAPTYKLTEFKENDQVVACRLPKDTEKTLEFVFMNRQMEEQASSWKAFGVPLIGSIVGDIKGSDVRDLYLKLLDPFITPKQGDVYHRDYSGSQDFVAEGTDPDSDMEFEFYTTDEMGEVEKSKLEMTEPITEDPPHRFFVNVHWPKKRSELHSNAFEIISPVLLRCDSTETLSLYRCLEEYLEEETISSWDCSKCKKQQEGLQKFNLCRLPDIFVIQLLRSGDLGCKLETLVDFPFNLDMAPYITNCSHHLSSSYVLYSVINHSGTVYFGHVIALVKHDDGKWYRFDDDNVSSITEKEIKTKEAYLLFYRRVAEG